MSYLIDGHNLIPKLGINLRSLDDEMELVKRLQAFCRFERRQVEVYFDGAPAGLSRTQKLGAVTAHFIRVGTTADNAIRARLKNLGPSARNWTVVTSDHAVQTAAHAARAQVMTSEEFARRILETGLKFDKEEDKPDKLDDIQVQEWLDMFRRGRRP